MSSATALHAALNARSSRGCDTPSKVQRWLNALPYNTEKGGADPAQLPSGRAAQTAHCMEAALFAAVVLEQHGYPPLVMSLESQDWLDHVIFVYQRNGRWGSVARSRDPGLHGRKPVFRIAARAGAQLHRSVRRSTPAASKASAWRPADAMGNYDWRLTRTNVWKVEQMLIDCRTRKSRARIRRYRTLPRRYRAYRKAHDDQKPLYYRGREALGHRCPREFASQS